MSGPHLSVLQGRAGNVPATSPPPPLVLLEPVPAFAAALLKLQLMGQSHRDRSYLTAMLAAVMLAGMAVASHR